MENSAVKFVAGITNLVGNPPFSLIALWSFISNFGYRIAHVASDCLTKYSSWTENPIFIFFVTCSHLQTGLLTSVGERVQPPFKGGHGPTIFSLRFLLLLWNWFCLSEHRLIRIFQFLKDFVDFSGFLVRAFEASASLIF